MTIAEEDSGIASRSCAASASGSASKSDGAPVSPPIRAAARKPTAIPGGADHDAQDRAAHGALGHVPFCETWSPSSTSR